VGSFPGLEINEIGGTNFVKSMFEWNLPPLRVRRLGKPSFYVTWARPALFVGGIVTNIESSEHRETVWDIGGQVDLQFTLLARLPMTFSIGYAAAFQDGFRRRDELMLSLKVL
jgi:hypothetical protein